MTPINTVTLTALQSVLFLGLCAWLIWRGWPEGVLSIYLSMATWTRSVMIFGVVHTWVLLAALLCAGAVSVLRRGLHLRHSQHLRHGMLMRRGLRLRLPSHDRWIIGWLGIWTAWMLALIVFYRPDNTMPILRSWLLNTLVPLPFILMFADDLRRIKIFAVVFLATAVVGGWFDLSVLEIPLAYLRYDPTLQAFGVLRLGVENYHFIGIGFAIALIMAAGLLVTSKSIYARFLIVLASAWCAYFLMLSGSKQSIFFGAVAVLLVAAWVSKRRGGRSWQLLLAVSVPMVLGVMLYQESPYLMLRSNTVTLSDVFSSSFAERVQLWGEGLDIFWQSPVWGEGFSKAVISHNLFVGTLADQGLVGFVFLVGILAFLARQIRGIGRSPLSDERTVWRILFICLVVFSLLRGQTSSAIYSSWELFWAGAFLWRLRSSSAEAPVRSMRHDAPRLAAPAARESGTVS